jgi:hypothetical protein
MLKIKPSRVSQMPLFAGWVLMNLRMKTGAISMAMSIRGSSLLSLVNINMPKPSVKYKMDKCFLEIIGEKSIS